MMITYSTLHSAMSDQIVLNGAIMPAPHFSWDVFRFRKQKCDSFVVFVAVNAENVWSTSTTWCAALHATASPAQEETRWLTTVTFAVAQVEAERILHPEGLTLAQLGGRVAATVARTVVLANCKRHTSVYGNIALLHQTSCPGQSNGKSPSSELSSHCRTFYTSDMLRELTKSHAPFLNKRQFVKKRQSSVITFCAIVDISFGIEDTSGGTDGDVTYWQCLAAAPWSPPPRNWISASSSGSPRRRGRIRSRDFLSSLSTHKTSRSSWEETGKDVPKLQFEGTKSAFFSAQSELPIKVDATPSGGIKISTFQT